MKQYLGVRKFKWITAVVLGISTVIGLTVQARPSYIYYCPRSNLRFADGPVQKGYQFEGDKNGAAFPHNIEDYWQNSSYVGTGFIHYDDSCTSAEFFCAEFVLIRMDDTSMHFTMFLPKYLEVGKSYKVKGVEAIVSPAGDPYGDDHWSKKQVQVTLWQMINGMEMPIKLNVEAGRGIVFWDGLDFWSGKFGVGETCFLQSSKGLFADVKISAKFPKPKR